MKRFVLTMLTGAIIISASSCKLFLPHQNDDAEDIPIPVDDIKNIVYYHDLATDMAITFLNYHVKNNQPPSCVQVEVQSPYTMKWIYNGSCNFPDGHAYGGETYFVRLADQTHECILYKEPSVNMSYPTYIDQTPMGTNSVIQIKPQANNPDKYDVIGYFILPVDNDSLFLHTTFSIEQINPNQSTNDSDKRWKIDNVLFDYKIYHDNITNQLVVYENNISVEPLEKQYNCPLALKGKIRIRGGSDDTNYHFFVVNYGNGECDNTITVSNEAGDTETIQIPTP